MTSKLGKSGFALIELMVMVVIVMILALALAPMFKEVIEKARYKEAETSLSAIRMHLRSAQLDHPELYRVPASLDRTILLDPHRPTRLANDDGIPLGSPDWIPHLPFSTNTTSDPKLPLYAGRFFQPQNYQLRIDQWNLASNEWMYCIAATGGRTPKNGPLVGSGIAILDVSCPMDGGPKRLLARWVRYTPARGSNPLFIRGNVQTPKEDAQSIQVPSYQQIVDAQDPEALLTEYGWKLE
jgi:type II secretory pathway pseudopilin PulG